MYAADVHSESINSISGRCLHSACIRMGNCFIYKLWLKLRKCFSRYARSAHEKGAHQHTASREACTCLFTFSSCILIILILKLFLSRPIRRDVSLLIKRISQVHAAAAAAAEQTMYRLYSVRQLSCFPFFLFCANAITLTPINDDINERLTVANFNTDSHHHFTHEAYLQHTHTHTRLPSHNKHAFANIMCGLSPAFREWCVVAQNAMYLSFTLSIMRAAEPPYTHNYILSYSYL